MDGLLTVGLTDRHVPLNLPFRWLDDCEYVDADDDDDDLDENKGMLRATSHDVTTFIVLSYSNQILANSTRTLYDGGGRCTFI